MASNPKSNPKDTTTRPLTTGDVALQGTNPSVSPQPVPAVPAVVPRDVTQEAGAKAVDPAADSNRVQVQRHKATRGNENILGASTDALGADHAALTETTPKKVGEEAAAQQRRQPESKVMADLNSPENLDRRALVSDARGFLRAKNIADHLYSDDVAVEEFIKYRDTVGRGLKPDYQPVMPVEASTHFDHTSPDGLPTSPPEAVTRAEYSTKQGDVVPHYRDKDKDEK